MIDFEEVDGQKALSEYLPGYDKNTNFQIQQRK